MHHERYVLESIRNRCYAPITTEHLDVIFVASPVFSTDMYVNFPVRTQVSCREGYYDRYTETYLVPTTFSCLEF